MGRLLACGTMALVAAGLALGAGRSGEGASPGDAAEDTRTFEFTYRAEVGGVEGKRLDVWLPYPPSNDWQKVELISLDSPWPGKLHQEPHYGNRMVHFGKEAPGQGPHLFTLKLRVERKEKIRNDFAGRGEEGIGPEAKKELAKFLEANRLVPTSGSLLEKILPSIAPEEANQVKIGRAIYDYVMENMKYSKDGEGWGTGSTDWACRAGYGNCTDFHSLFISLARGKGLPARFAIGFPIPPERGEGKVGGYHCWSDFYVGGYGWVPVDISEADKHPELADYYFGCNSEDRVEFTQGRDLKLAPPQAGEPLNYFIYPYVEVDGVPHRDVKREFTYRDLP